MVEPAIRLAAYPGAASPCQAYYRGGIIQVRLSLPALASVNPVYSLTAENAGKRRSSQTQKCFLNVEISFERLSPKSLLALLPVSNFRPASAMGEFVGVTTRKHPSCLSTRSISLQAASRSSMNSIVLIATMQSKCQSGKGMELTSAV